MNQCDIKGLYARMDRSFLEYASYVIRDRAIPNLADGLKPVQRRILWSLHQKDDGKFIKVANIIGHTMQYHPHGDASIGDALVVLVNKRYIIEGQGNFGNVYTGDPAAAARYIECRLTPLARETLFHTDLTEFVYSYDGRSKEPVTLPSKLPLLLMLGTEGIAVGLSSKILPHNFIELLDAQIAVLRKQPFSLLPDFVTGGLMDASEYKDGMGTVRLRARIIIKDKSTLLITEIPPTTTTESIMSSIEDAMKKGKIKVRSINDFTAEKIEIEIKSPAGMDIEKLISALYAFTSCETSISSRIIVIRDRRPVEMSVTEVIKENTQSLINLLRRELELKEKRLLEDLFFKTLVQIFVENRMYKKIEHCESNEAIYAEIHKAFKPHRNQYYRDLHDDDVTMLLGVRIRRISLFDMTQHKNEMAKVCAELERTQRHLKSLTKYAIKHLKELIKRYKEKYQRLTEIVELRAVTAKEVAFKSFKVTYDREKGYIGYKVCGDEFDIACSKYDRLLLLFNNGLYKVIELPDKFFIGHDLRYCAIPNRECIFTMVYQTDGITYMKRFRFGGMILNKDYQCAPLKSKILLFEADTPSQIYIKYKAKARQRIHQQIVKPNEFVVMHAKSKGRRITKREVALIQTHLPRNWNENAVTKPLKLI